MRNSRVFVRGIDKLKQTEITKEFSQVGRVIHVQTGQGDFGFVEFEWESEAEAAIQKLDGIVISGQKIQVEYAKGKARTSDPFVCFNCNKPGHLARDCKERPRNPNYIDTRGTRISDIRRDGPFRGDERYDREYEMRRREEERHDDRRYMDDRYARPERLDRSEERMGRYDDRYLDERREDPYDRRYEDRYNDRAAFNPYQRPRVPSAEYPSARYPERGYSSSSYYRDLPRGRPDYYERRPDYPRPRSPELRRSPYRGAGYPPDYPRISSRRSSRSPHHSPRRLSRSPRRSRSPPPFVKGYSPPRGVLYSPPRPTELGIRPGYGEPYPPPSPGQEHPRLSDLRSSSPK